MRMLLKPALALVFAIATISACSTSSPKPVALPAPAAVEPSAQERVLYYSQRIAESPRLYPMYTQLGIAFLDRTRETHDPTLLAKARNAENTALSIQDNFESLMAMTAVANYSHRFEDAIGWGRRAAKASVGGEDVRDPAVTAALVEAYLGFGKPEDAAALLPDSADDANDFHTAVSLGRLRSESGEYVEAELAFSRAAELAREQAAPALAAWAETAAAGTLIDSGRASESAAHLEAAARLAPETTFLILHRAEVAQAAGRHADALKLFETILAHDDDPAIEALAFTAAHEAGDTVSADKHFVRAERGLKRAIDAGEVYTLEALAKLYLHAGRNLESALALARENIRWKRDRSARETLAAIEALRR